MKRKVQRGFTLVELMVVVAIIAIISMLAYPSYITQVQRANRSDARVALNDVVQRQERFFLLNRAYASTFTALSYASNTPNSPENKYSLTLNRPNATTYTVSATGIAGTTQASDLTCARLSLDQRGTRSAVDSAGNDSTASCW